ncbi:MAG: hypothetical protein DMG92_02095 [Acidobacteria bacterium]|nr:MAG: hypothetical protein DMG92_02095 [Acidobacteriota bacterium]
MPISRLFTKMCFIAGVASLLGAAGCGGSGVVIPHPTGNFSNASFNGSYVYQIHGFLADGNNSPYREAGVITADGAGHITDGIDAFSSSALTAGPLQSSASVTGTYTVANDGTGQILLGSTGLGTVAGVTQISLALTLQSTSNADLMEADNFASGAGSAELQDPAAISAAPNGTFVFRLHQEVNAQSSASSSEVGFFTLSAGSLTTGSMDQSLFPVSSSSLTLTAGTFSAPTSFGSGTAALSDSSPFQTNFLYYIVNSAKFVLFASNSTSVGSGSAELQSGAVANGLAGSYAFGSRGDDFNLYAGATTVGQFTGTGATISSGALNSMTDGSSDASFPQPVPFTGTPTSPSTNPSPEGRVQVTLSTGTPLIFWMVSPSRAFFLVNTPTVSAEDGTADLQTTSSFSAASLKGQFAIVMDGIDKPFNGQFEGLARIGTLQFDGVGKLTLVELANASQSGSGATSPGAMAGTYQVSGDGRVTGTVGNGGGGLTLVMYAVSGTQAYVLQADPGTNTSGMVQLQQ